MACPAPTLAPVSPHAPHAPPAGPVLAVSGGSISTCNLNLRLGLPNINSSSNTSNTAKINNPTATANTTTTTLTNPISHGLYFGPDLYQPAHPASSTSYAVAAVDAGHVPDEALHFSLDTHTGAFSGHSLNAVYPRLHHHDGFMADELKFLRARKMSQTSIDHELSGASDVKPLTLGDSPTDLDSPEKKRKFSNFSSDPIDYPRRRATIACEICRSRKSRCDGGRPKCKLCAELNADCVYREPGVKLDAGNKLIIEHLNEIKSLIQSGLAAKNGPHAAALGGGGVTSSPAGLATPGATNTSVNHGLATTIDSPDYTNSTLHDETFIGSSIALGSGVANAKGFGAWLSSTSMPRIHTTPAFNLLQWPKIRDLVSQRWDPQILVQVETHRPPLQFELPQSLDLSNAHVYAEAFFKRVNVWYACVSPYSWNRYYHNAQSQGFREGAESCIALLVLALGCASTAGSISQLPQGAELPGYPCFLAAWAILPSLMLRSDILAAQCQILAAAYLFYAVRPLEAWNLLSSTSTKLQLLLNATMPAGAKQLSERVFWNAMLFESDLLAELELPQTGILQLEDAVGMPTQFENTGEPAPGIDDLRYFNAEITLRRLLNRISNTIYPKTSPITSTAALDPIAADFDGQLIAWYNGLPPALQFDYGMTALASPVQNVLRLRYFACRTIIYRPYVLAVLIKETAFLDPVVQDNCRKCLEACVRQLENVSAHHAGHMPYLWQGALSIVSQTLLLMGATLSPSLAGLLPQPHQVNAIVAEVVQEVQRYAHLAPSLRLAANILADAEDRRRQNLRSPSMRYMNTA